MSRILTIIPYNFYPALTGGALRCYHILMELAKIHEVHVLTVQPIEDFYDEGKYVFPDNVKVWSTLDIKSRNYLTAGSFPDRVLKALYYRLIRRSLRGNTNQFLLDIYPLLKLLLKKERFDLVLFENLEAVELTYRICKMLSPNSFRVYDAHNVDSELWSQLAISQKSDQLHNYAINAYEVETKLYKKVDAFLSCSSDDYDKLNSLNKSRVSGTIIPNGVNVKQRPFDKNPTKYLINEIIFCGTLDTVPNKEGLLWFYDYVFPILIKKRPTIQLTIIGRVTDTHVFKKLIDDASVNFIGNVETVVPYYNGASVAIVPLLSGSGTRLKILEAMSLGNPVVSTKIGAEGIECHPGKNIFIIDQAEQFAEQIDLLIGNETLFNEVRVNALNFVTSFYSWHVIGNKINRFINDMLDNGCVKKGRK
jgi:polysaccharide biosynthesis protein PslH